MQHLILPPVRHNNCDDRQHQQRSYIAQDCDPPSWRRAPARLHLFRAELQTLNAGPPQQTFSKVFDQDRFFFSLCQTLVRHLRGKDKEEVLAIVKSEISG
jgi:hypothetical protein